MKSIALIALLGVSAVNALTAIDGACEATDECAYDACCSVTAEVEAEFFDGVSGDVYDCTTSSPCSVGYGWCEEDSGCEPGLECYQRESFGSIPGITGLGSTDTLAAYDKTGSVNYCYDPDFQTTVGTCQELKRTLEYPSLNYALVDDTQVCMAGAVNLKSDLGLFARFWLW
jgi:hypothetical protein